MQLAAIAMAEQPRSGCTNLAQGCQVPAATLGASFGMEATPTGLRRLRKSGIGSRGNFDPLFQSILDLTIRRNPVGVAVILRPITQGSRAEAR